MKNVLLALIILAILPCAQALGTSDFYTKFISMEEDLTEASMTYVLCNPLKEELPILKASGSDYYADALATKIPAVSGNTYYILDERPVYEPAVSVHEFNATFSAEVVTAKAVGTEPYFRLATEKDILKPEQCETVMVKSVSEPRYMKDALDVVPTIDLQKAGVSEKEIADAKLPEGGSKLSWREREWWNITFLNLTRFYINNSNNYDFSAYPVEINVTLVEADADGHDIRVVCEDSLVEFGVKAYGSQKFGIRFRARLGIADVNDSCYAYYNPTKTVKDVRADWDNMYWNLWFNATENYWNWQDMLVNEENWYMTVIDNSGKTPEIRGQFAITASTSTRPNPTFSGVIVPNRALIKTWHFDNSTSQEAGVNYGENDVANSPYSCYKSGTQRQTVVTGRAIIREYSSGGSGTILAQNSSAAGELYWAWVRSETKWNPSGSLRLETYTMNTSALLQMVKTSDSTFISGSLGFAEDNAAFYHALGYRQYAASEITAYAEGNDTYTPETPANGTADPQNINIEWGAPTQRYCVNTATLREFWSITINSEVYQKTKDTVCDEGCENGACKGGDWIYYIVGGAILLLIALIASKR